MLKNIGTRLRFRTVRIGYWSLMLLSVLAASRWLFEDADPGLASTYQSEALGYVLAAAVPGALLLKHLVHSGAKARFGARTWIGRSFALAAVLSGPAIAGVVGGGTLQASDATIALLLCPVVVAVAGRAGSYDHEVDVAGLLWPSLVGLTALLLLVPEPALRQVHSWVGLAVMPLIVGLGATFAARPARATSERVSLDRLLGSFFGLLFTALVLAGLAARKGPGWSHPLPFTASGLDGLSALLTVVALGTLGAFRWCAQFLLIPLVGIAEGVLFLHPTVGLRTYVALGLLTVSCGYQLLMTPLSDMWPEARKDGVSGT